MLIKKEQWLAVKKVLDYKHEDQKYTSLKNINITDKHLEATDGHFAIRILRDEVGFADGTPGIYDVLRANKHGAGFLELYLEKQEGLQYPDIKACFPHGTNEYLVNARGGVRYIYNLVYQITVNYDFTQGFIGVRKKIENGQTISNMFELY